MKFNRMQLRKLIMEAAGDQKEADVKKKKLDKSFAKIGPEGIVFDISGAEKSGIKKKFFGKSKLYLRPNFDIDEQGNIVDFKPTAKYKMDIYDSDNTKLGSSITLGTEGFKVSPRLSSNFLGGNLNFTFDIKGDYDKIKKYKGDVLKGVKIANVRIGYSKKF